MHCLNDKLIKTYMTHILDLEKNQEYSQDIPCRKHSLKCFLFVNASLFVNTSLSVNANSLFVSGPRVSISRNRIRNQSLSTDFEQNIVLLLVFMFLANYVLQGNILAVVFL